MADAPLIRRSALHAFHLAEASLTEDHGWQCADSYGAVDAEVQAVREQVGLSDISPLAKLDMQGNDIFAALGQKLSLEAVSCRTGRSRPAPGPSASTRRPAACCVPWPGTTPGSSPRPEQPAQSRPRLKR